MGAEDFRCPAARGCGDEHSSACAPRGHGGRVPLRATPTRVMLPVVPTFDSVVFAGGGNRCVWQAGFYRTVGEAFNLAPARVAAASAGAAVAAVLFAGCFDAALAHFKRATAGNSRNAYWANLFNGAPIFPHAAMYRRALLEVIENGHLRSPRCVPDPTCACRSRAPPRWLDTRTAFALAGLADAIEQYIRRARASAARTVAWLQRRLRESARMPHARGAGGVSVLASSCTPPFTPLFRGMAESRRSTAASRTTSRSRRSAGTPGATLVLLSRRYRRLPTHASRVYVQPSMAVPPVSRLGLLQSRGLAGGLQIYTRPARWRNLRATDGRVFHWLLAASEARISLIQEDAFLMGRDRISCRSDNAVRPTASDAFAAFAGGGRLRCRLAALLASGRAARNDCGVAKFATACRTAAHSLSLAPPDGQPQESCSGKRNTGSQPGFVLHPWAALPVACIECLDGRRQSTSHFIPD